MLCSVSCWANDFFPDEKVRQLIIIENNTEKCFQPDLWNAKNDEERNAVLSRRSEMDIIIDSQYEIALMTELFGNEVAVKIFEDEQIREQFNQKLKQLSTNDTTVITPLDCESLSKYRLHLKKKHIN